MWPGGVTEALVLEAVQSSKTGEGVLRKGPGFKFKLCNAGCVALSKSF